MAPRTNGSKKGVYRKGKKIHGKERKYTSPLVEAHLGGEGEQPVTSARGGWRQKSEVDLGAEHGPRRVGTNLESHAPDGVLE